MRFKLPFSGKRKVGYDIRGENNKIIIVEEDGTERELGKDEKIEGANIDIIGDNNRIIIKTPCKLCNLGVRIRANNSSIIVGKSRIETMWIEVCSGNNQYISIGDACLILGATVQACEEKASFICGKNSLISFNVIIWCGDGHSVVTPEGTVINNVTEPVELGEHCWIGYGVTLYKNSGLAKNSVVGGSSVVTKKFDEENIVIAGNPAKIIKKNINWDIKTPHEMERIRNEI